MARKYARDTEGKFASTGGGAKGQSAQKKAKAAQPKRSSAKKTALVAGATIGATAVVGVLKVRSDALGRYDARTAAAVLKAANARSAW